jgi:large subunit ribosomal protein L31e
MAEQKQPTLERSFNVPLRKGFIDTPKYKRTKKAVHTLQEFIRRHMKSDNVKLGKNLNAALWKHGIKNPPHHVEVTAFKDEKGIVKVELKGQKYTHKTKEEKEAEKPKESKLDELKSKITGKESKPKKEKIQDESTDAVDSEAVDELKEELSGHKKM